MPELPEVETVRRGLAAAIVGKRIIDVTLRHHQLRFPLTDEIYLARGQLLVGIERRSKYLRWRLDKQGELLIHLGMRGVLAVEAGNYRPAKHDHVIWRFDDGSIVRYYDPRRFGCVIWSTQGACHQLLAKLGPEPLSNDFSSAYLKQYASARRVAIKVLLMDACCVVGVGNIYAAEACYLAGVNPLRQAGQLTDAEYRQLVDAIREVLRGAIAQGGTTLRDFVNASQQAGYFQQQLQVYGRGGQPCRRCAAKLHQVRQLGRSTVYCPQCQEMPS